MTNRRVVTIETDPARLARLHEVWGSLFEKERSRLGRVLKARKLVTQIEHVGSTAVAGLAAKPIIDVAVGLDTALAAAVACGALARRGYEYDDAAQPGTILLVRRDSSVRRYNIHLTIRHSRAWLRLVAVRDYLRSVPSSRAAYERAKAMAAKKGGGDAVAYAQAKSPALSCIALKALRLHDRAQLRAAVFESRMRAGMCGAPGSLPPTLRDAVAKLHVLVAHSAPRRESRRSSRA